MSTPGSPDPKDLVRYWLHRELVHEDPPRYSPTWVHASEVTRENPEFCPREWALYDVTGRRPRGQDVMAASAVAFAMGRTYQGLVTEWLASRAVGNWSCVACWHRHEFCRKPGVCESCGGKLGFRYVEMRFTSRKSGISCGVDVLVDLPTRVKLTLVEVKTEKQDTFKSLVMPRAEHRVRTALYLRIISESGDAYKKAIDTTQARVLYVSKGGWGQKDPSVLKWKITGDGGWSPFKEYVVERDDVLTRPYHASAQKLHRFRSGGVVPHGICPTQFTQRAKSCPVVGTCFSGQLPAGRKRK